MIFKNTKKYLKLIKSNKNNYKTFNDIITLIFSNAQKQNKNKMVTT